MASDESFASLKMAPDPLSTPLGKATVREYIYARVKGSDVSFDEETEEIHVVTVGEPNKNNCVTVRLEIVPKTRDQ